MPEDYRNDLAKAVFGRERDGKQCVTCGSPKVQAQDFKDDLSRKEFHISFMCQACQDKVFNSEEEY